MTTTLIHDPNSKASREIVERAEGVDIVPWDAITQSQYPAIAQLPCAIYENGVFFYPNTWEEVLENMPPSRTTFHQLASDSDVWRNVEQYAPALAMRLYTALIGQGDESAFIRDLQNTMVAIIAQLGTANSLETQDVTAERDDGASEVVAMSQLVDEWLERSFFRVTYAELKAIANP